jgi:hypothetical protein
VKVSLLHYGQDHPEFHLRQEGQTFLVPKTSKPAVEPTKSIPPVPGTFPQGITPRPSE